MLDRYLLLYNDNGVVVGAGYTDVHVELPALWLLIGLAAVAVIVASANVRLRTNFGSTLSERRYLRTVFLDSPVRRDLFGSRNGPGSASVG